MRSNDLAGLESSGTDATDKPYTYHVEPPAQGGKTYVRCTECGAELLTDLGGAEKLVHVEGCSVALPPTPTRRLRCEGTDRPFDHP